MSLVVLLRVEFSIKSLHFSLLCRAINDLPHKYLGIIQVKVNLIWILHASKVNPRLIKNPTMKISTKGIKIKAIRKRNRGLIGSLRRLEVKRVGILCLEQEK